MSLTVLSKEESRSIYKQTFASIKQNDFFSVEKLETTKVFYCCNVIDEKALEVIEFTSDANCINLASNRPLEKQQYVFKDHEIIDVLLTKVQKPFDIEPQVCARAKSHPFAPEEEGFKSSDRIYDKIDKERRSSSRKEDRDRKSAQQMMK